MSLVFDGFLTHSTIIEGVSDEVLREKYFFENSGHKKYENNQKESHIIKILNKLSFSECKKYHKRENNRYHPSDTTKKAEHI